MKKILFGIALISLVACNSETKEQESIEEVKTEESVSEETDSDEMAEAVDIKMVDGMESYGAEITAEGAVSPAELNAMMEGKERVNVKLATTINSCCKKKGCWMKLDMAEGDEMMVRFKDYGFFVPLNSEGRGAIVEGEAYLDTTSVDELRHYAEDAGNTEDEIAAITEPEISVRFMADGVLLK